MVRFCEHTAPMSDRVSRRRAQTRERIFIEAMRLFAERGFDRVTVADITEAADVGKGTFFTHFPLQAGRLPLPGRAGQRGHGRRRR